MRFLLPAALLLAPVTAPSWAQEIPDEDHFAEEVAAVASDPAVQAALASLDRERSFEDVVTISEVPAPPFGEGPRAALVRDMLAETGFGRAGLDDAGNVIAYREGRTGERVVAVLAHIDTVFPPETDVRVRRDGRTLTGPGVGDNARGVVLMLEMARAIADAGLRTEDDVMLVGTVGEEGLGDLSGVRHLFRDGAPPIHAALVIDGGEEATLVTSAIGSNRYRVTYEGPGGHSWGDFGAPNPHHALGRAIANLDEAGAQVAEEMGPKVSYNIGTIKGGTSVNSIPYSSAMLVDLRSGDPEALSAMDRAFRQAVQDALTIENQGRELGTEALTLDLEEVGRRPAGEGDLSAPLIQRAVAALRETGLEPRLIASSTDANVPISLGIPAVTMARGGISQGAHSADERWTDTGSQKMTRAALLTLLAEAGY